MKQVGVLPLRAEYDFRAALSEHDRGGFTYAAARPGYDDDLAFNSVHEVLHSISPLFGLVRSNSVLRLTSDRAFRNPPQCRCRSCRQENPGKQHRVGGRQ
jgi:hypothetical protein